ncbi:glycosyl hydrolase family 18 protein [Candidatus Merdisoma sp. JLR.KK011]|jgi:spore germination protein YaaH|uniref:glycosyl hydrolase family 18 protein n=1 Tax=Candidatus Merdisoma sp. JLR.KK011 TaxID=3114299 RepID=UPI002FF2BB1D
MAAKNRRKRRRSSARRSGDRRQLVPVLAAVFLIVVILIVMLINYLVKKYSPSDERMDLSAYFNLEQGDEAAIILEDDLTEFRARILDGEAYVTTDFLYEQLNQRFYWDAKENLLLYTTPTEVITASVGSNDYTVAKAKYTESYAPVKVDGDTAYVALKYIQKYTAMEFEVMTDEINRVHIQRSFGAFDTVSVKKDARVRFEPNIKSPILTDAVKGDILYVLPPDAEAETELPEDWTRVRTGNGFVGYIRNKYLGEKGQETKEPNYADPEYPSIQKDYTINMAWHQVTNADANNSVLEAIAKTKGLTTISPTWFFLNDNEGNIQSLASQTYVNYCHQNGIEVWALVNDIEYKDTIKDYEILSRTSSRQRLVNNLIAKAIEFDLDGLNIDFEFINAESAKAYIQFIRELSIMCRLNGIVLSVDNYVPADHNLFYNRKEQGIVADYVIIMGYDEHYATSPEAGSVASIDWVRKGIENTLSEVPAEKVINAVPFYTRLWEERPKTEEELAEESENEEFVPYKVTSKAYGMDGADRLLSEHNAEKVWNDVCGQYYAEFTEEGSTYKIWLEEEESIELKAALIREYNLAGIAAWKLGFERQDIWDIILRYVN